MGGNLAQALVGQWTCQVQTPTGPATETDVFMANGEFSTSSIWQNGASMSAWGNWSLPMQGTIRYNVASSSQQGMSGMQLDVPFRMPSPYVLQTATSTCQKTG